VPPNYPAGWPAAFGVVPTVTNQAAPVTFDWNFGDGTAHGTNQFAAHAYAAPGTFNWKVISSVSTASVTNTGIIQVGNPMILRVTSRSSHPAFTWPATFADAVVEQISVLTPITPWSPATNISMTSSNSFSVGQLSPNGVQIFRLRQVQ
jgi:PKD repeat protein